MNRVLPRRRSARADSLGRVLRSMLALALSLGLAAIPAAAEDPSPEESPATAAPEQGHWEFDLAAYGWLTDMTGTTSARDTTVDVDPQLWDDIVQNLNGALMGGVEVRYRGRWLLNVDLVGASLSDHIERGPFSFGFGPRTFTRDLRTADLSFPVDTPIGTLDVPVQVDPGTLRVDVPRVNAAIGPFDVDVDALMIISRAQVGYRVLDKPALELLGHPPSDDHRRVRVDLFAGLRYWYLRTEIDIESPPIRVPEFEVTSSVSGGSVRIGGQRIPPRTVAIPTVRLPGLEFGGTTFGGTDIDETASNWWIDPLIGIRVGAGLTERVGIVFAANIGGFDIGSASKFSWETLAYLDWRFGETTSLALGYRALGLDRRKGDAQADLVMHGPLLGLIFRF
jgi:hypothetical protein